MWRRDEGRLPEDVFPGVKRGGYRLNPAVELLSLHPSPGHHREMPDSELRGCDIRIALDRIGRSRAFAGCDRLIQFLNFVVEATLRGDSGHLKETTVGVVVFGRRPDYDPKADNIVRSHARRLRARLTRYYEQEGAVDRIAIAFQAGSYVPRFTRPAPGGTGRREVSLHGGS
jgi:hypothetical protein